MIVVDASVLVEALLVKGSAEPIKGQDLCAPHLIDAEVGSALRAAVRQRRITRTLGESAMNNLMGLTILRFAHLPLVGRAWSLRDRLSFYDALYIALAESIDAPLLTRDRRLARISGTAATIELIA